MLEEENAKVEKFLNEYKTLIEKHQFYIGSCGCCDSPFIMPLKVESFEPEDVGMLIKHLKKEHGLI